MVVDKGENTLITHRIIYIASTLGLAVSLSGCQTTTAETDFDASEAFANAMIERVDLLSGTVDVPTSGSAAYSGYIFLNEIDDPTELGAIGELDLTAKFGAASGSQVTGTASNFESVTGDVFDGTLAVTNGTVSSGFGGGFSADLDGTMTWTDEVYVVDGQMNADFAGDTNAGQPAGLDGTIQGSLSITVGANPTESFPLVGNFVAEQ